MAPTADKEFTVPEFFKAYGINSIGNTLLSSRNTVVLDKDGDLLIELNASDSQKSCGNEENRPPVADNSDSESTNLKRLYRFKVRSRTMRRASAVWNAMLFGP
jgi:beta-xylosidase